MNTTAYMPVQSRKFIPELYEYMQLNGYRLVTEDTDIRVATFRRGAEVLLVWNDRIERRIISSDKQKVYRLLRSFRGWDGKSMFRLAIILHLLDAVALDSATKESRLLVPQISDRLVDEFKDF